MGWIDDAAKLARAMKERNPRIREQANTLFNELWEVLTADVGDARKVDQERCATLETNGLPEARVIQLQVAGPVARMKKVTVTLLKAQHQIVAQGDGVDVTIDIDVCADDNVVCLKIDGERIEYPEASMTILRPFLYPEFYPAPPSSGPSVYPTSGRNARRKLYKW
jgi:hypothetical protein